LGKILGIGPSAHSYDGVSRSWNITTTHLKAIQDDKLPNEIETLSEMTVITNMLWQFKNHEAFHWIELKENLDRRI
jgi:coproporphyrinogen III oxidase-like Fe-S oxidoreductase